MSNEVQKDMLKKDLVDVIAGDLGLTKKDTELVVDAVFETIGDTVATGQAVQIIGFGKFDIREAAARTGRNPQTGEEIHIEAKNYPRFKAGKNLRDKVL